jgi:hypothetical protein
MKTEENKNDKFFESLKKHPKYKLGKRVKPQKEHNVNGKVAFTTTLYPHCYEWLKEESAKTGKSGSELLNSLIEQASKVG